MRTYTTICAIHSIITILGREQLYSNNYKLFTSMFGTNGLYRPSHEFQIILIDSVF